jgi:hypothetical protein
MSDYLDYICDPDGTLRWRIGVFSLYYIALATGILISYSVPRDDTLELECISSDSSATKGSVPLHSTTGDWLV